MSERVTIFEMGPRDGLQNERKLIATADKIRLIDLLSDCGFAKIETTSFVSPKWVPQMGDASDVMAGIKRKPGVSYTALTPNLKGFEAAQKAGVNEIAIFGAASESFSLKNINCSIAESVERFKPVVAAAQAAGIPVRGYVSCVVECPYSGAIAPAATLSIARELLDLGCYEISLGDTIGKGTPNTIASMLDEILTVIPANKLAGHYHDTGGQALENIDVSLERGIRTFDAAVGGLGGCPYAPGAKGNVATGAVLQLLGERGFETAIDPERLRNAEQFVQTILGRTP